MSSKHLRRMMAEKEQEKEVVEQEEEESEEEQIVRRPAVNRFAMLGDDDEDDKDESEEESEKVPQPVKKSAAKKNKKKNKKKTKKEEELDEDALLEKMALEDRSAVSEECAGENTATMEQLMRIDPKKLDPSEELKRALGKAGLKDNSAGPSNPHRKRPTGGRLCVPRTNWPPLKTIGLSMEPVKDEGHIRHFRFTHNKNYEKLERFTWLAEDNYNLDMLHEVLGEAYYHLNALLLLANAARMQDDITNSCDLIARAIYLLEQNWHAGFVPTSYWHRIDYTDYESRACFLVFHRHMLNCVQRRCFETALNFGKFVFSLDPQGDPLAMFLMLDSLALKARQYDWLIQLHSAAKEWKNLDLLPNFRYSLAMAHFHKHDKEKADELLTAAIISFPTVVTELLSELQMQADSEVETNSYLSVGAHAREPDGLRLLIKIYVKESVELWREPKAVSWLERVTRATVRGGNSSEMEEWKAKRARVFVGTPPSMMRLAVLLGYESSKSGVTDPAPPANARARYTRDSADNALRPDSFLSGLLHSLYPDYNSAEHLLDEALAAARRWIGAAGTEDGQGGGEGDEGGQRQQQGH